MAASPALGAAQSPAPVPTHVGGPRRVDLTKIQSKALLPKRIEHQEYVVATNKLGQVSSVLVRKGNGDPVFVAQTYGNAQQTFIRTSTGRAIVGTYRLTYDYDPHSGRVRRSVTLIKAGGVNPNAPGIVTGLLKSAHVNGLNDSQSSIDPKSLPDLPSVTASTPTPAPH